MPSTDEENRLPKNFMEYGKLYRAAITGDWETGRKLLNDDPKAYAADITVEGETVIHIAAKAKGSMVFLKGVLDLIPDSSLKSVLEHQSELGKTALAVAAIVDNAEAAELLVTKHPGLLYIPYADSMLPVSWAAMFGNRETVSYLIKAMDYHVNPSLSPSSGGAALVSYIIFAGFIDLAWDVIWHNPHLATTLHKDVTIPLVSLAMAPDAFPSGKRLNFLQSLIYFCVPLEIEDTPENLDSPHKLWTYFEPTRNRFLAYAWRNLGPILWEVAKHLPFKSITQIQETKRMHQIALKLLRFTCHKTNSLQDEDDVRNILYGPFMRAAEFNIPEVIEEILGFHPMMLMFKEKENGPYIFQVAVECRHEKVFNLIYQSIGLTPYLSLEQDEFGNNILHSAGLLPPPDRLNRVPGPALQMQRELQWFKEVEKHVKPYYRRIANKQGKTPKEIFTEEHRELVLEGEKWMKDSANSCTVSAALIATVAFAAAITIPGGNKDNGNPIFSQETAFDVFAVFDAISLFSSTAAITMFMSIYTARYAEADFLYALPKRLILGLISLFLSVTSMMLAFVAAIYLVFGHKRAWILIPVGVSAALPITLFVTLQFPLLLGMIYSTYGPGIFGKKSNRIIY